MLSKREVKKMLSENFPIENNPMKEGIDREREILKMIAAFLVIGSEDYIAVAWMTNHTEAEVRYYIQETDFGKQMYEYASILLDAMNQYTYMRRSYGDEAGYKVYNSTFPADDKDLYVNHMEHIKTRTAYTKALYRAQRKLVKE